MANTRMHVPTLSLRGASDDSRCAENASILTAQRRTIVPYPSLSLLLVLVMLGWACVAGAAEVKLTPGIRVGGAYDDNVLFSNENEVDSTVLSVRPNLEMDYQTLVSEWHLKADWDILRYLDESDLDRTNQYYRLNGEHRIKDRWRTYADLRYNRDTTLNSYLQEIGRVYERVQRDYFNGSARLGYNLSTISWISAGYRYINASYDSEDFSDYDSHSGNLYYSHELKSEIDRVYFGPAYYHRANDFNDVDSYSLNVGWERDWSAITNSDLTVGARYAQVDRDDGTSDESWGAKADFEFTREGIVSTTTIRYFHDLRTNADGDDINVDNFYLTYRRSLSERFGAGFDGRLVFSYKLFDQESDVNDTRYYWLEPYLYYRLTRDLGVSLRYRYQNNVEFQDEGDVTRERNIIWLQFRYGLTFLL